MHTFGVVISTLGRHLRHAWILRLGNSLGSKEFDLLLPLRGVKCDMRTTSTTHLLGCRQNITFSLPSNRRNLIGSKLSTSQDCFALLGKTMSNQLGYDVLRYCAERICPANPSSLSAYKPITIWSGICWRYW
jgi:hypothetical protein